MTATTSPPSPPVQDYSYYYYDSSSHTNYDDNTFSLPLHFELIDAIIKKENADKDVITDHVGNAVEEHDDYYYSYRDEDGRGSV